MKKENFLKALQTIALGNSQGFVSDDELIKACENYKAAVGHDDDYGYFVKVTKSLQDSINGVEQDKEIAKAIVPGQTKVIDGIMYVYTATPNAKTDYDWRVAGVGKKTGKTVGRGPTLDKKKIDAKQKYVNELFPQNLDSIKVIKQLGGSTGAQLVEDAKGNKYVLKKGSNTSKEHVKSEYIANQLYNILGVRTPDYEMYEADDGEVYLLSRFISNAQTVGPKDYPELAKFFMADTMLANWDAYQNDDNCLRDAAGHIVHVDNGGALEYRARGDKKGKNFDGDILKSFIGMRNNNQSVYQCLDTDEVLAQIDDLKKKKDDVVNYLKESGEDHLADILAERFDNLDKVAKNIKATQSLYSKDVEERELLDEAEMYREFTDEELEDLWKNADGKSWYNKVGNTGKNGWALLSEICKARGFDARPRVVEDDEYWNEVQNSKNPEFFRGLYQDYGSSFDIASCIDSLLYDDDCFYGTMGVWGQGIYAHVNDGDNDKSAERTNYMQSDAYRAAKQYGQYGEHGCVVSGVLESDAKVAKCEDLMKEILMNPPTGNSAEIKKLKAEKTRLEDELKRADDDIANASKTAVDDVYTNMHYDSDAIKEFFTEIDKTNWGKRNDVGDPDIPDFAEFVKKKMAECVSKNGGDIELKGENTLVMKLPNSDEKFTISKLQYSGPFALKGFRSGNPYNYSVERFKEWFTVNHIDKVEVAKKEAIDNLGDAITKLKKRKANLMAEYDGVKNEIKKNSQVDADGDIMSAIYEYASGGAYEAVGLYAALKGYDAVIKDHGNGGPNSFYILLNRSKLVVNKKYNVVK